MAKISISLTLIITLIYSSSCSITYAQESPINPKTSFKNVYAFGDSFTDTGNTRSIPGGAIFVSNPPYGRTYFNRPTNRYSDGRLVVDFLMESLSLPFLPPYIDQGADKSHGVNFAVSGSTAIDHSFFVRNGMWLALVPQSLGTELGWFEGVLKGTGCVDSATTPRECEAVFNDALIWVGETGANDYAYSTGSLVLPQTIQQLAVQSVADFLQAMLKKGAKYMVVQGLPPLGCLASTMKLSPPIDRDAYGCSGSGNRQSSSHNEALKAKLDSLRKDFPQSIIVYADYYNAYLSVLKNASSLGFRDLFNACCGLGGDNSIINNFPQCGAPFSRSCSDPSQYVNWDGVHLTEAMYKAVADAFFSGTNTQPPFADLLSKKAQS